MKKINTLFCVLTLLHNVLAQSIFEAETYNTPEVRGIIENTINSTINGILANLSEPVSFNTLPFNFENGETLSGYFNASNVKISGIKDFVAENISFNVFLETGDVDLFTKEVSVEFKYLADLLVFDLVPFYGEGRMGVFFDNIQVGAKGEANMTEGVKITNITLMITLSEAVFEFTGLIDNPEYSSLISNILNDNFAKFVDKYATLISKTISPIIESVLNSFLEPDDEKIVVKHLNIATRN